MSCSDITHDKLLDVVVIPCVQCLLCQVVVPVYTVHYTNSYRPCQPVLVVRQFQRLIGQTTVTILYQWEYNNKSTVRIYTACFSVSLLQVRDRFHFWKQCVTEAIRHRCLEEVHTKNSRIVQLQEPCTT